MASNITVDNVRAVRDQIQSAFDSTEASYNAILPKNSVIIAASNLAQPGLSSPNEEIATYSRYIVNKILIISDITARAFVIVSNTRGLLNLANIKITSITTGFPPTQDQIDQAYVDVRQSLALASINQNINLRYLADALDLANNDSFDGIKADRNGPPFLKGLRASKTNLNPVPIVRCPENKVPHTKVLVYRPPLRYSSCTGGSCDFKVFEKPYAKPGCCAQRNAFRNVKTVHSPCCDRPIQSVSNPVYTGPSVYQYFTKHPLNRIYKS